MECGFEQCLVDPCVFRLMVAGDVVAMMVFHVDDIKIAATEKVTEVVVSTLNQSCLLYTSPSPRDQRGSRMPSSA